MRVDAALRKTNPDFEGFYTKIPYPSNLKKMLEDFDNIMAQMLEDPEGDEARIKPESLELDVQLDVGVEEEEQPSSSTWVAKGHKKHKTLHIPDRVVNKAYMVMLGKHQYFVDMRQNYL